jgi:hypothetical protein
MHVDREWASTDSPACLPRRAGEPHEQTQACSRCLLFRGRRSCRLWVRPDCRSAAAHARTNACRGRTATTAAASATSEACGAPEPRGDRADGAEQQRRATQRRWSHGTKDSRCVEGVPEAAPSEGHRQARQRDRQGSECVVSSRRHAAPAACGRARPGHQRSVAPVAFATAATTFSLAASISASLSVRSRGWNTTSIASEILPDGRRSPW